MARRKYMWIIGLLALIQTTAFAQKSDATADWWKDSSKVATKSMPQFNEFMNNQYPYPATPRNQWEFGFHAGYSMLISDVDTRPGFGGGFSVRKALGHVFSVRADYTGSFNYGMDYKLSDNPYTGGVWVRNYRNKAHQGDLSLVASLNTLSHYRGNPKTNVYVFGGYSLLAADVDVDANQDQDALAAITFGGPRKDIKSAVKDVLDGEYETNAIEPNGSRDPIGRINDNALLRHAVHAGVGVSFRLTPRLSLGIEEKFTMPFSDDMDGIRGGQSRDYFSYTALRGGWNLGNPAKKVAPLWWINPNNYIYNELNVPKHMKLPKPELEDTDGDGVIDQFDLEPNTPAGARVDSRGRALDTDGDGVPDYKDKELLTPQSWFPVNADGVGTQPEPACCKELRELMKNQPKVAECNIGGLPSIQFAGNSVTLGKDAQALLAGAAAQIKANPNCKVKVIGYGATDKRAQQLSWDRVNAVIKYLVEKQGISESRLIFTYGEMGANNTIDLQGTTESGPNTVPAPHPNMRQTK